MAQIPINTEPKGMAPMSVGGNRNALNCAVGPDGKRDWSHGLFGCFSACGVCCMSCWCPCIVFSKNKQRIHSLEQGTPLRGGGDTFDDQCCIHGCLSILGYGWILQISSRGHVRDRYRIAGGGVGDCFASWCCQPCALTQESREIELEENSFQQ